MGLALYAYNNLKKLDVVFDSYGEPIDPFTRSEIDGEYIQVYISHYFPTQADGLVDRGVYSYGSKMNGWSGAYSAYSRWRETLAKFAGYTPVLHEFIPGCKASERLSYQVGAFEDESGPFYELICFSDCDGVIGAKTSAKLAKDFALYEDKAKQVDEVFYSAYDKIRKCFEFASEDGVVCFL